MQEKCRESVKEKEEKRKLRNPVLKLTAAEAQEMFFTGAKVKQQTTKAQPMETERSAR